MREFFDKLFKRKSFYVVFSIIMSIVLWAYVEYVDNPTEDVEVRNAPVVLAGEDVLAENNLIVTTVSKETVSFDFSGSRNTVAKLNYTNVTVSVDLTQILKGTPSPGTYDLSYTIIYPEGISSNAVSVKAKSVEYITVTVEKLVTKQVSITGNQSVTVADGYKAEPMEFYPGTIAVTGPESVVNKISYALVTFRKEDISQTVEESVSYVLLDEKGNQVDTSRLTTDTDTVLVRIPVVVVKEVALTVDLIYGASTSAENVSVTCTPATITLSGDAEVMATINSIDLGTIDLTDFALTNTSPFTIVLPNDVTNESGETTASVKVEIKGLTTKKLTVDNIQVKNSPTGLTTTIITQSIDVTIRGDEATLAQITADNIRIVADLSEIGNATGTYSVIATVSIDGFTNADVIGEYKVTVTISS